MNVSVSFFLMCLRNGGALEGRDEKGDKKEKVLDLDLCKDAPSLEMQYSLFVI